MMVILQKKFHRLEIFVDCWINEGQNAYLIIYLDYH